MEAEPKELWQRKLGEGYAGPVVVGGRVIVFHREGDEILIEALSAADGKQAWKFSAPTDYQDGFGMSNGPRATPTVADMETTRAAYNALVLALRR